MDIQMKLLIFAIDLILPLGVGYACRYQSALGERFFNKMILNNILLVCPVVSFLSFWVLPLTQDLLWLPVVGLIMGLAPGGIAYWVARRKYESDEERGSFVMAAILSNLGTIGGLCVFLLYGEKGYGYQQIIVLFQYILMFMFCYPLARLYEEHAHKRSVGKRVSVKSVLLSRNQLAVLGILFGGMLQLGGVERPAALDGASAFFIHLGAWTGLIPVGYSMDFAQIRRYYKELTELALIKFVASPLIVYLVTYPLADNPLMRNTLLVLSCTPVAVNAVVTCRLYHLNVNLSVAGFIVTTLLFMIVEYPLLFLLLSK